MLLFCRLFITLQIIATAGIHFSQSSELKSFSDILGFSMEKYEKQMFDICPFTDFCTKSKRTKFSDKGNSKQDDIQCCPQCSCKPNCFLSQSCCIDALLSTEIYSLIIADHITCSTTDMTPAPSKEVGHMYKIVVSCPGLYGKKQSCEKPIDKKTRPEDIVLVSSKDGLVIFWNEDCARCHGITDIIRQ
jgi:hypothetical protein